MDEFPTSVDVVIYGTGIAESVLSAALSLCGKKVLHIDRLNQYGGVETCVRFDNLLEMLQASNTANSGSSGFLKTDHIYDLASQVSHQWHIPEDESQQSVETASNTTISQKQLLKCLARTEVDLMPKIIRAQSGIIDAILRSDVSRYLEFSFVKHIFALQSSTQDFVPIPQTRSDVFDSSVLSLIQKRKLTKCLESCLKFEAKQSTPSPSNKLFYDVLKTEYQMDTFLVETIVDCLTMSPRDVTYEEGMSRLKSLLHSVNRFGPYPLLLPLYGTSDIGQGFCRMSAVFGSTFCLDCHVVAMESRDNSVEVQLSIGQTVTSQHFVTVMSHLAHEHIPTDNVRWMARAVYIVAGKIFSSKSDNGSSNFGSSLLVVPRGKSEEPFLVLQSFMKEDKALGPFYIVHVLAPIDSSQCNSTVESLMSPVETLLFPPSRQHQRLLSVYFRASDFRDCAPVQQLPTHMRVMSGFTSHLHSDVEVEQAERMFHELYPDEVFLTPPPKPEDIVFDEANESNTQSTPTTDKEESATAVSTEDVQMALSTPTIAGDEGNQQDNTSSATQ